MLISFPAKVDISFPAPDVLETAKVTVFKLGIMNNCVEVPVWALLLP